MITLDLSIVIVNYNVKYFLEQCLRSVFRAMEEIEGEVIVVDNHSTDGSQAMLREKFGGQITLIENQDNPGFSKANNQGMRIARGRYILLLNPDTVVEESTFSCCLTFMDAHPRAGALGVKMIDGNGKFLPESKRALPTPWVSFYKIFGLSALFPRSKTFGQYHLTYLDRDQNHPVEILSGAFMWMRRSVLDEIGLLDETFFMYGEDIDLSYRVILAGYQNYYLADTQIIHYKGESTKKGSLNYVRVFYQAMIIFAHKHFGGSRKRFFIAAIRLAVYFRAAIAVAYRLVQRLGFPLIEGGLVYGAARGVTAYWEYYIKYIKGGGYEVLFLYGYLPSYALLFVLLLWVLGAYQRPFRLRPLVVGPFLGFVTIATVTYMVSFIENYSRAIVGLTSVFTMLIAIANRGLINYRERGNFFFQEETRRKVLLLGTPAGIQRLENLIQQQLDYPVEVMGALIPELTSSLAASQTEVLGGFDQLDAVLRLFDVDEVVFDNQGLATTRILEIIAAQPRRVGYKVAPSHADFLVGPQEIVTAREVGRGWYRLQQREARFTKRSFDLLGGLVLLMSYPLFFWLYHQPGAALRGIVALLGGRRHMVGYATAAQGLPALRPGLLSMRHRHRGAAGLRRLDSLDRYYARVYRWDLDLEILLKGWRRIGA